MSIVEFRPAQESNRLMNLLIHDNIVFYKGNFPTIFIQKTFQDRRRLQRTAELDALRGVHQLYGKYVLQIVHDAVELGSGIGTHTDVVFLSVGGNNRIAARRVAIHLVLTDHRSGCVLRYHKAGIQSGICHQKFGQASQSHDKLCYTAFGDVAQLGKGYPQEIVRDGKRLAVEVTAGMMRSSSGKMVGLSVTELISVSRTEET